MEDLPRHEIRLRAATPDDAELVQAFIGELAAYEKLTHELQTDADALRRHLAPNSGACAALIASVGGEPVGFALYFETYSTFWTAVCLHLEDLFVRPTARGLGVGKALLAAVAAEAAARGCPRLQWNVLDWNQDAIGFYEGLGAAVLADWKICRLDGAALAGLAQA